MFEIATIILLIFISIQLKLSRSKSILKNNYFFEEENYLLDKKLSNGVMANFQFYTVAEFSEVLSIDSKGLKKELGFSDFVLIYDEKLKQFMTARVKFIGVDGYARGQKIGFYSFLSSSNDWVEVNICLTLDEYNKFFKDLKTAAFKRKNGEKNYFLYSLDVVSEIKLGNGKYINSIDRIKNIGMYDEYHADKIHLMIELKNSLESNDIKQKNLCEKFYNNFLNINL